MRFKNYTQAYFLIKNNPSYAYSLGERAKAIVAGGTLFSLFMMTLWPSRIYAPDKIWSLTK